MAPNILARPFEVMASNRVYGGDLTYIPTAEGWLSLAVVIDLFSRAVVGGAMAEHRRAPLVNQALTMALQRRQSAPGLVRPTDRGSQYGADRYLAILQTHGIQPSMSRQGDCWDNAVVERFFHRLKTELIYWENFNNREQAPHAIFEYIEVFYNRQRRHSTIGYLAPLVYEQTHTLI